MNKINLREVLDKIDFFNKQKEKYEYKLKEAEAYLFCARVEYENILQKRKYTNK